MSAKFPLGQTVITSNAQVQLDQESVLAGLQRHAAGDWGDVDEDDRKERMSYRSKKAFDCSRSITTTMRRSSGSLPKLIARRRRCCYLRTIEYNHRRR